MSERASPAQDGPPQLVANRYQVEATLGKGGMAVVYQVLDASTQRKLALKQLLPVAAGKERSEIARLFEQEFHTLSQLAHPGVIEVYDYGLDETGPYYTMELLDGGDLRELAPLPWKRACSLIRDVCSSLSLLHSRRLVHRDLTPRNIRCTRDGRAKLIDFGAMIPMGPNKHLLGTPPFTAPEVVNLQVLDARADLYSLGATAYYTLTAKQAYPAKDFSQLRDLWRHQPTPPSAFVENIPRDLDNLVMSMLNIDPMARPANAAEVMERLSALAGLGVDEQLLVSQAYVSTPTLVGRDEQLLRVRKLMNRALHNRGVTIVIEGASGAGRSRFLDACVLEAKLAGAIVMRADASDSSAGKWGAVRTMATQLLDALPDMALPAARPHVPVLGHVLPEMLERSEAATQRSSSSLVDEIWVRVPSAPPPAPGQAEPPLPLGAGDERDPHLATDDASGSTWTQVWGRGYSSRPPPRCGNAGVRLESFDSQSELRPRVQAALRDWLLDLSRQRFLMLAVDDVHKLDEPSAAFVAFLSNEISDRKLAVAATTEIGAPATSPGALKLLAEAGVSVTLRNLDREQVERLLGSMFGEAPNVKFLADRLYAISNGNARSVMQLVRHLADTGSVRYEAGAWTLPSSIVSDDLPGSLTEALKARVGRLGPDARRLAQAMALSVEQSFSFDECLLFVENRKLARLIRGLDELVASEVLSTDGQYYCLSQPGWVSTLTGQLEEESKRACHLQLAAMYEQRGTETFRAIAHLVHAGEEERALDMLIAEGEDNRERLEQSAEDVYEYVQSLPPDWVQIHERLMELCRHLRRPKREFFSLQRTLVALTASKDKASTTHLLELLEQLVHDSGLAIYRDLGDSVEPSARLGRALELAQQRFDASAEAERILAPADAIRVLAQTLVLVIKQAGSTYDYSLIASAPSLEPFLPLSPALGVVDQNVKSTTHVLAGRAEQARVGYLEILERIEQPDRAELEDTYYTYVRLSAIYAVGMIEASFGIATALRRADEIETDPWFQVNAWRIRMVYYLRQGNADKTEEIKKHIELLKIQNSPVQYFEGTHLWTELLAHASADDLMQVKQVMAEIEKLAELFASWRPILHFARGEYNRIRGDYEGALAELGQALQLTGPGRHQAWLRAAGSQVLTLFELGRFEEAMEKGRSFLAQAQKEQLGAACNWIRAPLALAEAGSGDGKSAVENAKTTIEQYRALGMTGLFLGSAFETRARVAVMLDDRDDFVTYARLCAEQYRAGHNPALTAKYEKLTAEARRAMLRVSQDLEHAATYVSADLVATVMTLCQGPEERAQRALKIMVAQSNCSGGFLYTMQERGLVLSAATGSHPRPSDLDAIANEYLVSEIENAEDATMSCAGPPTDAVSTQSATAWASPRSKQYRPVLLGHSTPKGFAVTGLALMRPDSAKPFQFPGRATAWISEALLDAGDVVAVFAAD